MPDTNTQQGLVSKHNVATRFTARVATRTRGGRKVVRNAAVSYTYDATYETAAILI